MKFATFDLVIFDLDGTLVDSLPDIEGALNRALAEVGRPPIPRDQVRTLVGEGVVRLAEKALAVGRPSAAAASAAAPAAEVSAQAVADRVRAIYREAPCVASRLYPGIERTLTGLRGQAGRRLAVLTNKPGEVTRPLLDALGISPHFDAIIGDGDGHPRKPDPAALHALASRFAVPLARTLMVGDGLPDMAVARAAGCASAAALWGYTARAELLAERPSHALEAPEELLG